MTSFDINAYLARSGAWICGGRLGGRAAYPLPAEAIRTLKYMQDIESHTIVYLRSLLATRAIDDPDVATFLACWVYEESLHGLALERFLAAAGHPLGPRPKPHGHEGLAQWARGARDRDPVPGVAGLLRRAHGVGRDQRADDAHGLPTARRTRETIPCCRSCSGASRATSRGTSSSTTARPSCACGGPRLLGWPRASWWTDSGRPVGSGVQPERASFASWPSYLFGGTRGPSRRPPKVDETIRRLPGFGDGTIAGELARPIRQRRTEWLP